MTGLTIRPIRAADTHDLRRRVLRSGDPRPEVVRFAGDDRPDTVHLGAFASGVLVGVATWMAEPVPADVPGLAGRPGLRLRGMAVDPSWRGRGVGRVLLAAGMAAAGDRPVWCHARDSAIGFYQRAGWRVVGEGFVTEATGLPHHLMVLAGAAPGPDGRAVTPPDRRDGPAPG